MGCPDSKRAIFDLKPGESLLLGGIVRVELVQKSGQLARFFVESPREVHIEKVWPRADADKDRANPLQASPSMAQ